MPFLKGEEPDSWREYAISEFDYSATPMRVNLGIAPKNARLFMVADKRWKFMHAEGEGKDGPFPPMLFDLENDPNEFEDLGRSADHQDIIAMMYERLGQWGIRMSQRTTKSEQDILNMTGKSVRKGIVLGGFTADEKDPELTVKFRGKAPKRPSL
jgi:hypothetical protein